MAGIQVGGAGSGLDINSLVSQLVSAEGAPIAQRITRQEVAATTKISALGTLKGALGAFKSALEPLRNLESFQARKAVSADADYFSVTADSTAVPGHYDIEIENLATAHQLASDPFLAGATANVGYGKLTITVGAESFEVDIADGDGTLAEIRDAINASKDNESVTATLLRGTEGTRLVLTSTKTGEEGAIEVAASGGNGGLAQLTYDPDGVMNMEEKQEAKDALIYISGIPVESSTNVVEDAIEGVAITLKKAELGKETGLDVSFDSAAVVTRVQKFVTEFNTLQIALGKLGSYDANTKAAGPMLGDALLRGVQEQLRRGLSDTVDSVSGAYTTLASVGIKTTITGALELNQDKLKKALDADPDAVAQLFGSTDGVAARLYDQIDKRLATGAEIDSRNTRLNGELKNIAKSKEALSLRMAQIEARYRKQFTALDTLLGQLQSTSSYLAQQLANLPKPE